MTDSALRLVLFDWDGTLADSFPTIRAAMEAAFRAKGLPPFATEELRRSIGLRLDTIVARLMPTATAEEQTALAATYRACFADEMGRPDFEERLFPGVAQGLATLAASNGGTTLLGVATGKSLPGLRRCLVHHALERTFVVLQTPDTAPGKPHPGMVLQGMAALGVEAGQTVVVGDTTYDIEMARNAGVEGLGVSWGLHDADALRAAGAAAVFDTFGALVDRLLAG